jgi:Tfp pilus assembly protein PilX
MSTANRHLLALHHHSHQPHQLSVNFRDRTPYMSNQTKLLCFLLKAQRIADESDRGYSMLMVSIISIILFSLLVATTVFSNMAKSRTNAFVDGTSAFYVAEAGLNKRAGEINNILQSYSGVKKGTASTLETCLGVAIPSDKNQSVPSVTDDLGCVNYRFNSSNNIAKVASGDSIALDSDGQDQNTYVAYTFVTEDTTKYVSGKPVYDTLTDGEFSGLKGLEYKYRVSATGKKPVGAIDNATTAATAAKGSGTNVSLSMTFTNTVVPLFQFGIFYNGDLELNPTRNMEINGRVHSNANMYLQPAGLTGSQPIALFKSKVSASGSIYNRVDAWVEGVDRTGITSLLKTGSTSCVPTTNCHYIPNYDSALKIPLTAAQMSGFTNEILKDSVTALKAPDPGFTRKRNYNTNKIGDYFAKADMRLEMVPDRDIVAPGGTITNMSGKTATPWTRNQAIIPFNFTAITTGGTGTCTTTLPAAGVDPVATYVDSSRENYSNLRCRVFSKGQLQSLRQPVMVLTNINQTRSNTSFDNAAFRVWEGQTLGAPPALLGAPSTYPIGSLTGLSAAANTVDVKKKIIRALQVAIASTKTPITLDKLDKKFDAPNFVSGDLGIFKTTFSTLIGNISELTVDDRNNLLLKSKPTEIAALMGAWFLPAPIQRVERPTPDTDATVNSANPRSSGFYDGREERWITMLQTNIASLSVWNRDGLYVKADDDGASEDLKAAYNPGAGAVVETFASGTGTTNNTDGFAFDRVTTFTKSGTEIYPITGWQYLGLGSSDITEGGLVFHATVRDDLDGSGGTLVAANDVMVDTTDNTQRILKKNPDNTNAIENSNVIVLDYYRKYPNQTASRKSPFAFAFNSGDYLPAAMMLSSDQSIYIQGNFNNSQNGGVALPATTPNTASSARLPAAVIADTITVLSNQCLAEVANPLNVPRGQISCGLPTKIDGTTQNYGNVTSAIAINAAFLSNTQVSRGNLGLDRGYDLADTAKSYSGGANNYIRLLEDWNNSDNPIALNYYGSLVSLNEPIEYSGLFRSGGKDATKADDSAYYNVPFRNINYDTNFDNIDLLPPLTPKGSYVRQSGFTRKF